MTPLLGGLLFLALAILWFMLAKWVANRRPSWIELGLAPISNLFFIGDPAAAKSVN